MYLVYVYMVCMYVCSDAYMSVLYGRVCSYLCVVCVHVWYVYVLYVGGLVCICVYGVSVSSVVS